MSPGQPLLVLALLLGAAEVNAQADSVPTPTRRSPFDIFAGLGVSGWSGSARLGATGGFSTVGLGIEKPLGTQHTLRVELAGRGVGGDLGRTGMAQSPTTVWVNFQTVSGQLRRNGPRGLVLGLGGALGWISSCDVESRNGSGVTGSDVVACDDFTDLAVAAKSIAVQTLLTVGVERRRLGVDLRLDQDLLPLIVTSRGSARNTQLSIVFHIWLRRRADRRIASQSGARGVLGRTGCARIGPDALISCH